MPSRSSRRSEGSVHAELVSRTRAKPLIIIAGLSIEASTFSPARTEAEAFHSRTCDDVISYHEHIVGKGTELGASAQWEGALIGHALPGGVVTAAAFQELSDMLINILKEIIHRDGLPDGLWFDIHGAMSVEGMDDAEVVLLRRIRQIIGDDVLVSASMDPHGNVSEDLVRQVDLITCYRTSPHVDESETRRRACSTMLEVLAGASTRCNSTHRPYKAWIPIPILLAGEQTSTRDEPAKTIWEAVADVATFPGVIDAAAWVGYAWADEPRNRAAVVVTGWDEHAVASGAERLARLYWKHHADFHFVANTGSLDECLERARLSLRKPFFISDSGDNPTAGGAGDVTWTLSKILAWAPRVAPEMSIIYASLPAPEAVAESVEAGLGATVSVVAGARVDHIYAGPVALTGQVHAIRYGDPNAVIEVVLRVDNVFVILTKLRKPYHKGEDFTALSLHPRRADIVVVKIGYLEPELFEMAKDWMLALTPGGVDQDLPNLGHRRIQRPMWPFDDMIGVQPNLSARLIPSLTK